MRTTNIDESLGQHIESTQNWQQYTGERIRNLEQQQQQSHGGPTTVGLGLIPTSSSEPEASLGEDPHERYLVSNSIFTAFKTLHETKQKFAKF